MIEGEGCSEQRQLVTHLTMVSEECETIEKVAR